MGAPVGAEHTQRGRGHGDVAVAPALAVDVQHPTGAVHVGDLEVGAFQQAQPADKMVLAPTGERRSQPGSRSMPWAAT
jgi:hypothetical protein